jgi:hypothetical protein
MTIVLALLITFFIYEITRKLVEHSPYGHKLKLLPFIVGLLFGLHPIHVEALTWITSSMDMYGILFGLISFYLFILYREGKNIIVNYIGSVTFCALGIFTNELALSFPILIILYDFIFKHLNLKSLPRRILEYLPFFIIIGVNFYVRSFILHIESRFEYYGDSFVQTALLMGRAFFKYILLLFVPLGLTINHNLGTGLSSWGVEVAYPYSKGLAALVALKITDPIIMSSILIVILSAIAFFRYKKSHPLVSFGIGWFFITFVPGSNLIPTEAVMVERFMFNPSYGFLLIVAYLLLLGLNFEKINSLKAKIGWLILLIIVIFYTTTTMIRNSEWRSDETLFSSALRRNPNAVLVRLELGEIYTNQAKLKEALRLYEESLELSPKYEFLPEFVANFNMLLGWDEQAEDLLKRAIELDPTIKDVYFLLGNIYKVKGELEKAEKAFLLGIAIEPNYAPAFNNLGVVYAMQGKLDLAIAYYKRALVIDPNY